MAANKPTETNEQPLLEDDDDFEEFPKESKGHFVNTRERKGLKNHWSFTAHKKLQYFVFVWYLFGCLFTMLERFFFPVFVFLFLFYHILVFC